MNTTFLANTNTVIRLITHVSGKTLWPGSNLVLKVTANRQGISDIWDVTVEEVPGRTTLVIGGIDYEIVEQITYDHLQDIIFNQD